MNFMKKMMLALVVLILTGAVSAETLPVYVINESNAPMKLVVETTFMGPNFEKEIPGGAKGFLTHNGSRLTIGASRDDRFARGGNATYFRLGSSPRAVIEKLAEIRSIDGQNCWVLTIRGEL
ncbi:MAG: hypothetical protein KIS61_09215 [Candidatus Eremiobacteraeota bacterium]|nr:hypothetical protein [Candidatus Eremiobacteraeota bacterium]